MNIGDRVRLLRGREEGIITKLLPNDLIEIEIEEGFRIPVQRRELALVSAEEAVRFKTPAAPSGIEPQRARPSDIVADQGVYLAFVPLNDRELAQHLINNTDWDLPFSFSAGTEPHLRGLATGVLKARSSQKIQDLAVKDFEAWGTFSLQALYHRPAFLAHRAPLDRKIRLRAQTFFKNKQRLPVLGKEGHLIQLDDAQSARPSAEQLRERLTEGPPAPATPLPKAAATVDLHLEKLTTDVQGLSAAQSLDIQLRAFEQHLEAAIAGGLDAVTFIHGVGSGTLRQEVHRRLSQHPNVQYFEDAQKEKFGYGATRAKIK
jgi:hypothetical protein